MDEGYIYLAASYLFWSKEEPRGYWALGDNYPKGKITLLISNISHRDRKNWLRKSFRCGKCGLIIFEEKCTLPEEEKAEK